MKHIFVVDDDKDIRDLIRKYLEKEGYKVTTFLNGQDVADEVMRLAPDLIVLDIMMPGIDGTEVCKTIRRRSDTPIIFVSARGEEIDRIIGLEIGGDDYLAKPFSPRELVARIKNIFKRIDRRSNGETDPIYEIKNTKLSVGNRSVTIDDEALNLTVKEYDTLRFLMANQNSPLSRDGIIEKVWGYDDIGEGRLVDDVIKRLRKKLSEGKSLMEIQTVWGYGYKIEG